MIDKEILIEIRIAFMAHSEFVTADFHGDSTIEGENTLPKASIYPETLHINDLNIIKQCIIISNALQQLKLRRKDFLTFI